MLSFIEDITNSMKSVIEVIIDSMRGRKLKGKIDILKIITLCPVKNFLFCKYRSLVL